MIIVRTRYAFLRSGGDIYFREWWPSGVVIESVSAFSRRGTIVDAWVEDDRLFTQRQIHDQDPD